MSVESELPSDHNPDDYWCSCRNCCCVNGMCTHMDTDEEPVNSFREDDPAYEQY